MNKNLYMAFLWLAVVWLVSRPLHVAGAATYYVATNGVDNTDDGRGQSWALPYLTISNGVQKAANVDDLVLVSNGVYLLTGLITVNRQITVRSWNNGVVDSTNTILNGNAATRCFIISHTGAVVEGFTVYNGNGSGGDGGGVYMTAGTLRNCVVVSNSTPTKKGGGVNFTGGSTGVIDNCLVAHNVATNGGGIYLTATAGGTVLATNCVVRNNKAFVAQSSSLGGGGVWMKGVTSNAAIANCTIYENESAYEGGGVLLFGGIINNCVISNNYAYDKGGGVRIYSSGLITDCVVISNLCSRYGGGIYSALGTIINSQIIGNRATNTAAGYWGGGVYQHSGMILNCIISDNYCGFYGGGVLAESSGDPEGIMRNCLISGNVAGGGGGGIYFRFGNDVALENCTIVSNVALADLGGGIYMPTASTNYLANSIIYLNTVSSGINSNIFHYSATAIGSFSNCCFAPVLTGASTNYSSDNIFSDPQFVEQDTGNWRLKEGSPCVNAGVNRAWMVDALDLDGRRRRDKFSGQVDMGCWERVSKGTMFGFR